MWLYIYEVVEISHMFDSSSAGLYFRGRTAIKKAKEIAKKNGWKKANLKHTWGDVDDYGILNGVTIIKRKVEE